VYTISFVASESLRESFRRHMREQVLQAAHALTIERGWERVRVSEIASLVGVSRPTIYKEFGDKQGLGDAMVVKEAERFLSGVKNVLDDNVGDARSAIIAAVRFTLDEAARSPLLKAVLTSARTDAAEVGEDRGTGVLPLLTTSSSMLHTASQTLSGWFNEHFPDIDRDEVADGVDALVRLVVSHLVLPDGNPHETGRRISTVALRYLRLE
jgi:AcrR family transcriptional regulator